MDKIYVYGCSGHGLVVSQIAQRLGYKEIIFIDDGDNVYHSFDEIKGNNIIPICLGVGDNNIRGKLFKKVLEYGFNIKTLIDPSAIISKSAHIEQGTIIMPNVVVNAKARIGQGVILNTSSIIEHECIIGDFVHISPGVSMAGAVKVGDYTHIGIGSSIIQDINIGKKTIIGAGSVVVGDIRDYKKAFGSPCREIEDMG